MAEAAAPRWRTISEVKPADRANEEVGADAAREKVTSNRQAQRHLIVWIVDIIGVD